MGNAANSRDGDARSHEEGIVLRKLTGPTAAVIALGEPKAQVPQMELMQHDDD